jgi:(2S)-methylsuccinyl-CoA dehydrogenase
VTTERIQSESLTTARELADLASQVAESAIASAARLTDGGKNIDEHQVHAERIAQLATEARAAGELVAYAESQATAGNPDALTEEQAFAFAAEVLHNARGAIVADTDAFGVDSGLSEILFGSEVRGLIRAGLSEARLRDIGRRVIEGRGAFRAELDDEIANMTREHARDFARTEVAPIAQEMHRQDLLVPEDLIQKMAGLGLFGSSIPEAYGGTEMGYLTMVVLTEELSKVSLVAGSLITRSEILTRALLQGGTENQRKTWRPGNCWWASRSPSRTWAPMWPR